MRSSYELMFALRTPHLGVITSSFVYQAIRTPFGRYGGALSRVRPDDLGAHAIDGLLAGSPDLDPPAIEAVVFGNSNGAGEDNRNVGRMSALLAGLPVTVPGTTINRLCGSSLAAVMGAPGRWRPVTPTSFSRAGWNR